jgi:hypothetical protein
MINFEKRILTNSNMLAMSCATGGMK